MDKKTLIDALAQLTAEEISEIVFEAKRQKELATIQEPRTRAPVIRNALIEFALKHGVDQEVMIKAWSTNVARIKALDMFPQMREEYPDGYWNFPDLQGPTLFIKPRGTGGCAPCYVIVTTQTGDDHVHKVALVATYSELCRLSKQKNRETRLRQKDEERRVAEETKRKKQERVSTLQSVARVLKTVRQVLTEFASETGVDLEELTNQWTKLRLAAKKEPDLDSQPSKVVKLSEEACRDRGLQQPSWHVDGYFVTTLGVTSLKEGTKRVPRIMYSSHAPNLGLTDKIREVQWGTDGRHEAGNFLDDDGWRSENKR